MRDDRWLARTKAWSYAHLHRSRWRPGLLGVLLTVLVLAGCTQSSSPATPLSASELPADFQITVYRGQEALGGEELAFSSLFTQGKPVVLNFWAGLCPPCRAEMPDLQSAYHEYQDRVMLFGLDVGPFVGLGSRDDGRALLQQLNITYPTGTTLDRQVVSAYRILGMPTTVFMTPDGGIHRSWTGLLTEQKLKELLEQLLEASVG